MPSQSNDSYEHFDLKLEILPEYFPTFRSSRQINGRVEPLSHVNLMTDTLIANASIQDLRAILRALLANGPPGTLNALHAAARARIERNLALKPPPQPSELFAASRKTDPIPTQTLADLLATCRAMVGAGLGFRSLTLFAIVVRATVSLRWSEDGELMQSLAAVDSDISQAIQSCRERLEESDTEVDLSQAQIAATDLKEALVEGERAAQLWGGEFPFIRALANAEALNP